MVLHLLSKNDKKPLKRNSKCTNGQIALFGNYLLLVMITWNLDTTRQVDSIDNRNLWKKLCTIKAAMVPGRIV